MENNRVSVKKSTLWKGIVVVLITVVGFLALRDNFGSLTGNVVADPYAGLSFQTICAKTGGVWMKMQPTQNYAPTGQPACFGCMLPDGDHICETERYIQALSAQ